MTVKNNRILEFLAFILWAFALLGCQPTPRDVRQAGRDALENARIQLDSGNNAEALQFFKDAEHYGLLANDTLTVAHARFNIAANLGYYADKEEVASLLKAAAEGFGDDYVHRAEALKELGDFYQFHREYDNADYYLNQAMTYAEQSGSVEAKRKVWTAFFARYFNAGEYEKSVDYLKRYWQAIQTDLTDKRRIYYYEAMGNIFDEMGNMDSAYYYYDRLEELLNNTDDKTKEKSYFYFTTLYNYAKRQGDFEKACHYNYLYLKGSIHNEIEEKKNNLAAISQKYDSAVLQNELNQKIIHKQRIIIFVSGLATLVLAAFLVSQVRLARKRKQEAEINAELFHFKQQNMALVQKDAEHEQIQQDYAERLSEALDKEQQTMMLLDIYLNNSKKANLLNDLERSVFGEKDHWKAMLAVVEEKYPGLWETLGQKYPDLDEDEKKSFILSHFKVSRQEEADYLGTTVNMVDKMRGRVRKKMERHE